MNETGKNRLKVSEKKREKDTSENEKGNKKFNLW
jgi:hypothetical protein